MKVSELRMFFRIKSNTSLKFSESLTHGSAEESLRLPEDKTPESLESETHSTQQRFPERQSPGFTPVHYRT
ncbi:uncharacterized [Tachysurus ichikawai]